MKIPDITTRLIGSLASSLTPVGEISGAAAAALSDGSSRNPNLYFRKASHQFQLALHYQGVGDFGGSYGSKADCCVSNDKYFIYSVDEWLVVSLAQQSLYNSNSRGKYTNDKMKRCGTAKIVDLCLEVSSGGDKLYVLHEDGYLIKYQLPLLLELHEVNVGFCATDIVVEDEFIMVYGNGNRAVLLESNLRLRANSSFSPSVLDYWPIPVNLDDREVLLVDRITGICRNWHINQKKSEISSVMPLRLGKQSYGTIETILKISDNTWVVAQKYGWSLYQLDREEILTDLVTSPYHANSSFAKVIRTYRKENKFGVILSNGDVIWVNGGSLRMISENNGGFVLLDVCHNDTINKLIGLFEKDEELYYSICSLDVRDGFEWIEFIQLNRREKTTNKLQVARFNEKVVVITGSNELLCYKDMGHYLADSCGKTMILPLRDFSRISILYQLGHEYLLMGTNQGEIFVYDDSLVLVQRLLLFPSKIISITKMDHLSLKHSFVCIGEDSSVSICTVQEKFFTFPGHHSSLKEMVFSEPFFLKFVYENGENVLWKLDLEGIPNFSLMEDIDFLEDEVIYKIYERSIAKNVISLLSVSLDEVNSMDENELNEINNIISDYFPNDEMRSYGRDFPLIGLVNDGTISLNFSSTYNKDIELVLIYMMIQDKLGIPINTESILEYLLLNFEDGFLFRLVSLALNGTNKIIDYCSEKLLSHILQQLSWPDTFQRYGKILNSLFHIIDFHSQRANFNIALENSSMPESHEFENLFHVFYLLTELALIKPPNTITGIKAMQKIGSVLQSLIDTGYPQHARRGSHSSIDEEYDENHIEGVSNELFLLNHETKAVSVKILMKGWEYFKSNIDLIYFVGVVLGLMEKADSYKEKHNGRRRSSLNGNEDTIKIFDFLGCLQELMKVMGKSDPDSMILILCFQFQRRPASISSRIRILEFFNSILLEETYIERYHLMVIFNSVLAVGHFARELSSSSIEGQQFEISLTLLLNLLADRFSLVYGDEKMIYEDDQDVLVYDFKEFEVFWLVGFENEHLDFKISGKTTISGKNISSNKTYSWNLMKRVHITKCGAFEESMELYSKMLNRRKMEIKKKATEHGHLNVHCYMIHND